MNLKTKIAWGLFGLYGLAICIQNVRFYNNEIRPLEEEFIQVAEQIKKQYGTPIPNYVLLESGELERIVEERKEVVRKYHAIDESRWVLRPSGAEIIDGETYLLHPFYIPNQQ